MMQALGIVGMLYLYSDTREPRYLLSTVGLAVAAVATQVLLRRWRARLAFYREHRHDWHERLEEMPDVRAFPRVEDAVRGFLHRPRVRKALWVMGFAMLAFSAGRLAWFAFAN